MLLQMTFELCIPLNFRAPTPKSPRCPALVYDLYALTPDEIQIVEGASP